MLDLTGKKFNKLTVIKEVERERTSGGRPKRRWLCKCECGKYTIVKQDNLTSSKNPTKSCGCIRNVKNIINERYGRLVVLGYSEPQFSKEGHLIRMCRCRCDCGKIKDIRYNDLTYGSTISCGCYRREINNMKVERDEHGYSGTRLYKIWKGMKRRCFNEKCPAYKWYGAKGIIVCDEWTLEKGFMNFREWSLKHGYNDNLTIDRIDVNGNYEPNNCRWITIEEQSYNKSNNHLITYLGETRTLKEWSEKYNINRTTLYSRLKSGWELKDALEKPARSILR